MIRITLFWVLYLFHFVVVAQTTHYPKSLLRFHKLILAKEFSSWRINHHEKTQSLEDYIKQKPTLRTLKRNTIYVLPLGGKGNLKMPLVNIVTEYIAAFFGQKTHIQKRIPNIIHMTPKKYKRIHQGHQQICTQFILSDVLQKKLPPDGLACVGLSTIDLYPSKKWNFVFGQARLHGRVALASWYRHVLEMENIPKKRIKKVIILRTLKTITHELSHAFSIPHCTKYHCLMNGSNNQREADQQPWHLCPICASKLNYALETNLKKRYVALRHFFKKYGYKKEARYCRKMIRKLQSVKTL